MKACVIHKYGGIEELKIENVPIPIPKKGEVLIEIKNAALNHLDIWVRKGSRGSELKMPHILGSDASGIVKKIGEDVIGIEKGQEVILYPGLSCGHCESCISGKQTECPSFGIIGMTTPGTFAQYIALPAFNVFPKPAHMDFASASGLPLTFLTAWHMLFVKGRLRPKQTVLIHGIGGGVALAGLLLAKASGAKVISTSSSDEKLSLSKKLGADYFINYKTNNVVKEVGKITNSLGIDIAFDTAGASTLPVDIECVKKGGTVVLCGITTGASVEINLRSLYWKQINILGSTMGSRSNFQSMLDMVNQNKLSPVIDSIWGLGEIAQAIKKLEEGKQFGKIILKIQGLI